MEIVFHSLGKQMPQTFHLRCPIRRLSDGHSLPIRAGERPKSLEPAQYLPIGSLELALQGSAWNLSELMASSTTEQNHKLEIRAALTVEPRIRRALAGLAETDCPVLIAGEPGVGKQAIAAQIHALSPRSRAEFIQLSASDCSARRLLSALSNGGTVYLGEVTHLTAGLQEQIVAHYSHGKQPRSRLLCGTTHELLDEIKARRMREDFYHLISAVTLRISPLRFRKTEILAIAEDLLTEYSRQFDRPKPALSEDIREFLLAHKWPGNLTEFETAIKTFVFIGDQSISLAALKAVSPATKFPGLHRPLSLKEATRAASIEVERQLISEVLISTGGNRKRAADELGISYKALLYKLKQVETEGRRPSNGNGI